MPLRIMRRNFRLGRRFIIFSSAVPIPPNPGLGMPPAILSPVIRRDGERQSEPIHPTGLAPRSNDPRVWGEAFRAVRAETERRAAPLSPEDQVVQSMPDASPTKWHRAHKTWFFEPLL